MDLELVRTVLLAHSTVREGTIHGAPSFKLRGRIIACPAIHKSAEPDSLVVTVDKRQRAALIADEPAALYIVDHYAAYDVVLVRLPRVNPKSLRDLLDSAVGFVSSRPAVKRLSSKTAAVKKRRPASRPRTRKPRKR
jgi:hypothetical protein